VHMRFFSSMISDAVPAKMHDARRVTFPDGRYRVAAWRWRPRRALDPARRWTSASGDGRDGPKFYTAPIHYQRTWLLGKPGDEVREYSCSEDNVDAPHLGPGPGPIGWDGQRGYERLAPMPSPPTKDHPAVTSIPE
jgi:hypothetical protein